MNAYLKCVCGAAGSSGHVLHAPHRRAAGSHVAVEGKASTTRMLMANAMTKGTDERYMTESGTSASPFITKRLIPKGGVMPAMFIIRAIITPNQIRSQS